MDSDLWCIGIEMSIHLSKLFLILKIQWCTLELRQTFILICDWFFKLICLLFLSLIYECRVWFIDHYCRICSVRAAVQPKLNKILLMKNLIIEREKDAGCESQFFFRVVTFVAQQHNEARVLVCEFCVSLAGLFLSRAQTVLFSCSFLIGGKWMVTTTDIH